MGGSVVQSLLIKEHTMAFALASAIGGRTEARLDPWRVAEDNREKAEKWKAEAEKYKAEAEKYKAEAEKYKDEAKGWKNKFKKCVALCKALLPDGSSVDGDESEDL